jgi:sensor c-di-GMP phosphodiesterase-like protein
MDVEPLVTILVSLAGVGASGLLANIARRVGRRAAPESEPDITDRIEQLRSHLGTSAALIKQIESEFQLQVAALDKIKAESEENQRLAELNREQAEAVRAVIASANEKAAKPAKRQQWLFFGAGLFFSIPLGVGVNYLYDLIV